jgi:hypothetical protein
LKTLHQNNNNNNNDNDNNRAGGVAQGESPEFKS